MPLSGWSHDIRDPEAFVGRIVERSRRKLDSHQRERLHQFLLIELWQLSLVYDRGDPRYPSGFSTIAGRYLPRRIIDWERTPEEGGRTLWTKPRGRDGKQYAESYERERPVFISIEAEQGISSTKPDTPGNADREGGELGRAYARLSVDIADDRSPDLMRVLGAGSSNTPPRVHKVGKTAPRKAA